MALRLKLIMALLVFFFSAQILSAQSSWPRFRGVNGTGIAATDHKLPVTFDEEKNVLWQADVSEGHSSPVIWGDRIFLTGKNGDDLETICLNRKTGKIIWRNTTPKVAKFERIHAINSQASPSAVTDGQRVYVYFGSYGLLCYDFAGKEIWKRPLEKVLPNAFGTAASPILVKDLLIFSYENQVESYIEAINKETGKPVWHKTRPGFKSSWSTPVCWNNNGVDELIVYGVSWLTALDLKDGSDRWAVPGLADEPSVTPVIGDGFVFVSSYNMNTNTEVISLPDYSKLLEEYDKNKDGQISFEEGASNKSVLSRYDADGEGDHPLRLFYGMLDTNRDQQISETEYKILSAWLGSFEQENGLVAVRPAANPGDKAEIAWRYNLGVPECPSPLYYQGRIYLVKNGGVATCLDAKTGELKFSGKLGEGGPYYSSPIIGDGKIYVASARGVVTVFEAGDSLKILANNKMPERVMATPAIVDGKIYVRTKTKLLAFGLK